MAIYQYQIRQQSGAVTTGQVTANSLSEASGIARQQDGYLLDVSPLGRTEPDLLARLRNLRIEFGPGLKDVLNFTSQLSVMVKAGINVRGAVEGVAEQTTNLKFRKIVDQIRLDVESGKPFSDALA